MSAMPTIPHSLTVPEQHHLARLDTYLSASFPDYSRSFFKRLIEDGHVMVNGSIMYKQGAAVKKDDTVAVTFPTHAPQDAATLLAQLPPIQVLFEHTHFLIINKPANMLVHKAETKKQEPCLVDWLMSCQPALAAIGHSDRPGIVHRLDKDTSGLLIIARTNYAHTQFSMLFKDRKIKKTYHAVVHGHPPAAGTIELPIGRHPVARHKMATFASHANPRQPKREARTDYRVLTYFKDYSLVEAKPLTGRTHQIRVHLAAIGHPIVGDPLYSPHKTKLIDRQALHAHALNFSFDGQEFSFVQPEPVDFAALLQD